MFNISKLHFFKNFYYLYKNDFNFKYFSGDSERHSPIYLLEKKMQPLKTYTSDEVTHIIKNPYTSNNYSYKNIIVALMGMSWWWKWTFLEVLFKKFWIDTPITKSGNISNIWKIDNTGKYNLFCIELDMFFNAIWCPRYKEMLADNETFLEMFSNNERAIAFILKCINSKENFSEEDVYLKYELDRLQCEARWTVNVNINTNVKQNLFFLDAVHWWPIIDAIEKQVNEIEHTVDNYLKLIIHNFFLAIYRFLVNCS